MHRFDGIHRSSVRNWSNRGNGDFNGKQGSAYLNEQEMNIFKNKKKPKRCALFFRRECFSCTQIMNIFIMMKFIKTNLI